MDKIILQSARTFTWKTEGVFNSIKDIIEYIEEEYEISFEEYKESFSTEEEIINENENDEIFYSWLNENELQIIFTKQK